MKPIYLTGPMRNFSVHQKEEFEKAKDALQSLHKCTVNTAFEAFDGFDPLAGDCPKDELKKMRLSRLIEASMVVFLNDYEQDMEATFEVKAAKFLNINTIGINFALKPESKHGNGNNSQSTSEPAHASDQQS